MDLVLGTAQWGTPYGLTNVRGELRDVEIAEIVGTALAVGITAADTHRTTDPNQGYGRAQSRLRPWAAEFRITTKIFGRSEMPIAEQLSISLSDLGIPSVHACLVHDWAMLSEDERRGTAQAMDAVRASCQATKVGISAYDEAELASAVEYFQVLDVVQVPASVIDQRLVNSEALYALCETGAEIQVRSIFLQGLLLEPRAKTAFAQHPDITRFYRFCLVNGISPLAACLGFTKTLDWATHVVVGVTGADELQQIARTWSQEPVKTQWGALASREATLVDPRLWSR